MAPTRSGLRIIDTYHDPGALTGESKRWTTEDGTHWHQVNRLSGNPGTGDRQGYVVGGQIEEIP
jgi:hypothetical protein